MTNPDLFGRRRESEVEAPTETVTGEDYALVLHDERPLALRVSNDGNIDNSFFLPKSKISWERKSATAIVARIPEWLAIEKGLA